MNLTHAFVIIIHILMEFCNEIIIYCFSGIQIKIRFITSVQLNLVRMPTTRVCYTSIA